MWIFDASAKHYANVGTAAATHYHFSTHNHSLFYFIKASLTNSAFGLESKAFFHGWIFHRLNISGRSGEPAKKKKGNSILVRYCIVQYLNPNQGCFKKSSIDRILKENSQHKNSYLDFFFQFVIFPMFLTFLSSLFYAFLMWFCFSTFLGTKFIKKQTFYTHFWLLKTVGGTKKTERNVKNIAKIPFLSLFLQKKLLKNRF